MIATPDTPHLTPAEYLTCYGPNEILQFTSLNQSCPIDLLCEAVTLLPSP